MKFGQVVFHLTWNLVMKSTKWCDQNYSTLLQEKFHLLLKLYGVFA